MAEGESIWFANALGPQEKNTSTYDCGPCRLINGHFSVPMQWVKLVKLTDEYAVFKVEPTEQDRIAVTHLMDMPELKWEKIEDDQYYMSRAQYDACNEQL